MWLPASSASPSSSPAAASIGRRERGSKERAAVVLRRRRASPPSCFAAAPAATAAAASAAAAAHAALLRLTGQLRKEEVSVAPRVQVQHDARRVACQRGPRRRSAGAGCDMSRKRAARAPQAGRQGAVARP